MSAATQASPYPLRIGQPDDFARSREFLERIGFDAATLCAALGIARISDVDKVNWNEVKLGHVPPPLHWAIALFVRGVAATVAGSQAICGEETLAAFMALGLLRPAKRDPSLLVSPIWLYPADGFALVSDRRDDPDGEPFSPTDDVVFPAIYDGTLRFLQMLPDVGGGEALDLCGGCGVGALHLARSAKRAVTADVTARAAFFAKFNALLNGAAVESLSGDLYAPVQGRQFDLISAHPPFVPTFGKSMVFRDGGDTGEDITRRTIEGLPAHLRPGGTCVIVCTARDTEEGKFHQRVRSWLGAAGADFDVVLGWEKILSVEEAVEGLRTRLLAEGGEDAPQRLTERLHEAGTRQFVHGALFVRRCDGPITTPPLSIRATPAATAADFVRLLAWRQRSRQPSFSEWLSRSRPVLAAQLELKTRHQVQEGKLTAADHLFSIASAFESALRPDAFVIAAIKRFDGRHSVAEVFGAAERAGEFPAGFPMEAFLDLIRLMIEQGFLTVDTSD
jgi:SAM-dependent methyltransferase